MSDSDSDNEEGGGGLCLSGFLFGNIDTATGELEEELFDDKSTKGQLNALSKLGLGPVISQVLEEDELEQPMKKQKKKKKKRQTFSSGDLESSWGSMSDDEEDVGASVGSCLPVKNGADIDIAPALLPPFISNKSKTKVDLDDYIEGTKSASAVDFSDMIELAEDDISTLLKNTKDKKDAVDEDYDAAEGPVITEKLTDDKILMPPPPAPSEKKTGGSQSSPKTIDSERKAEVSPILSPKETNADDAALKTPPLAGTTPSKYAGVDVRVFFPNFTPGKPLRFLRLFDKPKAASEYEHDVWKDVKERRSKMKEAGPGDQNVQSVDLAENVSMNISITPERRSTKSWRFEDGVPPATSDSGELTEEEKQCYNELDQILAPTSDMDDGSDERSNGILQRGNLWRHGPAKYWYDKHYNTAGDDDEQLDYGFKLKPKPASDDGSSSSSSSSSDEETSSNDLSTNASQGFPVEAYHMVTQLEWEKNIIWDAKDIQLQKKDGTPVPSTSTCLSGRTGAHDDGDKNYHPISSIENPELVYGRWEDDIIWDVDQMDKMPVPKVLTLDPNDENIVLYMPDDIAPDTAAESPPAPLPPAKPKVPHAKKSKILLGKIGVINVTGNDSPSPPYPPETEYKDPYNISNDEYYQPKLTKESKLQSSASTNILQHSTPAVELRVPFIPTYLGPEELRNFHRPAIQKFPNGPIPILPLIDRIKNKAKQRKQERLASGGGDFFFMREPEDLTGKDGELLLIEYCEEHPPLLSQVGMCSKIKNYYKRKGVGDVGELLPKSRYGELSFAHKSPFLGAMRPGQLIPTLENNMYRCPIYMHPKSDSDFLLIRSGGIYYIREFDASYTAGQECPLIQVPAPTTRTAINFVRDFLQVFIYRLFWGSEDRPRRLRMEDIKDAFPEQLESSIRKRLSHCAEFNRSGRSSNWWVMKPGFRLPTEEELRDMISPEQCCAHLSLVAAEQRLKDAGYGEKSLFEPEDDKEDNNQERMEDEVKTAPWNTTRSYKQALEGKCLLQLTGPADPTGCGEGFSYVRVPMKPQPSNKEEQALVALSKRTVNGTDADLRRLSRNNATAILRKFGIPEVEIKRLSRWEVIDLVRTLSTEKAKAGETGLTTKFMRGNRFTVAAHQERYMEECQRIFDLQNMVLSSSEVLSTDEGESDEDDEEVYSELEEIGKNIESLFSNKKTSEQLSHEEEEQERRELQKMMLGEDNKEEKEERGNDAKGSKNEENNNLALSDIANHPGRVLTIDRTFKDSEGKEYTRTEIIRNPAIIEAYIKIRRSKDETFIRRFALLDDQAKKEMEKERRRLSDQLRRCKRGRGKAEGYKNKKAAGYKNKKPAIPKRRKPVVRPDLRMTCGACGQVGHMRTNQSCPLNLEYRPATSPDHVAMTESEEEEEIEEQEMLAKEEELVVKVDGTKLRIAGMVVKHDAERRSLISKEPNDASYGSPRGRGLLKRKRPSPHAEESDYLTKRYRPANRQRIDPTVTINGIFEGILNEVRELPAALPFHYPVNPKVVPNYRNIVTSPMDLQTMRENIRNKKYQLRSEFLADMQRIRDNSCIFNGELAELTLAADELLKTSRFKIEEWAEELERLERMINPLLGDDQGGLNFILQNCLDKLTAMPAAHPFLVPVNRKLVPNYDEVIKNPMEFETVSLKIKYNSYSGAKEFLDDIRLIHANTRQFNGIDSIFDKQGLTMINTAEGFIGTYKDHLAMLERNIRLSKGKGGDEGSHTGYDNENEGQVDGQVDLDIMVSTDGATDNNAQVGADNESREADAGKSRGNDDDNSWILDQGMDENIQQAVEAMNAVQFLQRPHPQ